MTYKWMAQRGRKPWAAELWCRGCLTICIPTAAVLVSNNSRSWNPKVQHLFQHQERQMTEGMRPVKLHEQIQSLRAWSQWSSISNTDRVAGRMVKFITCLQTLLQIDKGLHKQTKHWWTKHHSRTKETGELEEEQLDEQSWRLHKQVHTPSRAATRTPYIYIFSLRSGQWHYQCQWEWPPLNVPNYEKPQSKSNNSAMWMKRKHSITMQKTAEHDHILTTK